MTQSKTKLVNPEKEMKDLKAEIIKARDAWFAAKAKTIKTEVAKNLESYQNTIIHGLLGFKTDNWGRFEIDHCNGRAGNSEAGDRFRKDCKEAIDKWFAELTLIPKLTDKEKKDLLEKYRKQIISGLQEKIRFRAEADANEMLNSALDDALALAKCAEDQAKLEAEREKTQEEQIRLAVARATAETEARVRAEFQAKINEEKLKAVVKKQEETREERDHERPLSPEL